jgi:D-serine deaminase-like pyridoxal phosphate-dependent protein
MFDTKSFRAAWRDDAATSIERHLAIAPVVADALSTPFPVVDLDRVVRNVAALQAACDARGLANRPHAKTHKSTGIARYQIAQGAVGVAVQTLTEAEVMADAGIGDLLVSHLVVGEAKLARLSRLLARRGLAIATLADGVAVLDGLALAAERAGRRLGVYVECDTGLGRAGVATPAAAAAVALEIAERPALRFAGLMTYPRAGMREEAGRFLAEAKRLVAHAGLDCPSITTGGSPDQWSDDGLAAATEYRAGTSIYGDRSLVARGAMALADCALHVVATVVSRPSANRAVIDAGSKALTSDLVGLDGYGLVLGAPGAVIHKLDEEHGYLRVPDDAALAPGDVVTILPNHACPVSNLYDRVIVSRGVRLLGSMPIDARGYAI